MLNIVQIDPMIQNFQDLTRQNDTFPIKQSKPFRDFGSASFHILARTVASATLIPPLLPVVILCIKTGV